MLMFRSFDTQAQSSQVEPSDWRGLWQWVFSKDNIMWKTARKTNTRTRTQI